MIRKNSKQRRKREDFFRLVSSFCSYQDVDLVEKVYYGIIKAITSSLRQTDTCFLPDFGEFYTIDWKGKYFNLTTGKMEDTGLCLTIRFKASNKLKKYIKNMRKKV